MPRTKKVIAEDLENQELPVEDETVEVEYEEDETEEELEETTQAAETLKPKSKDFPDPKSKVEVMKRVIGKMASMESDELTKWWKQTEAQVGNDHYSDAIPDGRAGHNKGTITPHASHAVKESVKDDLKELFDADKTLNEEAKERLETIFEAAVTSRVMMAEEELEAAYEEGLQDAIAEIHEEMSEKIEQYADWAKDRFFEENEIAVENTIKTELAEEFIGGLKELFEDHFIDVPESKVDVTNALAERVEELEGVLDGVIAENDELKDTFVQMQLEGIVSEVSETLTEAEAEKFEALCEDVDFEGDFEAFYKRVEIIKETYFKDGKYIAESEEDDLEKTSDEPLNEETKREDAKAKDPSMQIFVDALSRTAKDSLR